MEGKKIVATYPYITTEGEEIYQVVRYEPKDFRARRLAPDGSWAWSLSGGWYRQHGKDWHFMRDQSEKGRLPSDIELPEVRAILYRIPDLLAKPKHPVFVVEGEKDADLLAGLGLVATTSPFGAGHWHPGMGQLLKDRRVVVVPDHDFAGWNHAGAVCTSLMLWGAAEIRMCSVLPAKDMGKFLEFVGGTKDEQRQQIVNIVKQLPSFRYVPACQPDNPGVS